MGEAFDVAWSKVADHFAGESVAVIGEARTTLAKAVIELAGRGLIEQRALEEAAREALSKAYPQVPPR
jgi:hypothetical protein